MRVPSSQALTSTISITLSIVSISLTNVTSISGGTLLAGASARLASVVFGVKVEAIKTCEADIRELITLCTVFAFTRHALIVEKFVTRRALSANIRSFTLLTDDVVGVCVTVSTSTCIVVKI